ncbi:response regulator transcription factor [Thiomicrorhabdus arctica]|jgi:DNA-binding response OmpR family regulator|uniref:response regulator transcription factor n=1 Tax=Thiomicrorhabdus arctica TaxID=131540 RepID=UPI00036FC141|nr:response regulator transcription factor [Thiomicrorhabdus arctica]
MPEKFHALIIEDDPDIARLVAIQIDSLQGSSHHVGYLDKAQRYCQLNSVSILILDLSLPDGDGLDFCRMFRQTNTTTPILMLTARSDEIDRVLGLELGADDYLGKPFGLAELKARIKALLRRSQIQKHPTKKNELIQVEGLTINSIKHQAHLHTINLTLTSKEFELLKLFATYPNQVFSRMDLLEKVWGIDHDGYEHTVNSHLNRLRKKLETDPAHPKILETVWGVGYKLNSEQLKEKI